MQSKCIYSVKMCGMLKDETVCVCVQRLSGSSLQCARLFTIQMLDRHKR